MNILSRTLFSFGFVMSMLIILAVGAAVATFIENDYGTTTAKALVYSAKWYEVVMILLGVSLVGVMYRYKLWKKPGSFLFHGGFVVILIGAGVTRYIGYEGIMHIREGESTNKMVSAESFLEIKHTKDYYSFPLRIANLKNNYFKHDVMIDGKELTIEYLGHKEVKQNRNQYFVIKAAVTYNGQRDEIELAGKEGASGMEKELVYDNMPIVFSWGSKNMTVPFKVKLVDFQLERYPGSMSPSSYASEVVLIDKEMGIEKPFRIFMNNTLDHRGFRFFQSSYDMDEMGTILSVNNDPGKLPTYIGYFMLALGFILNFFEKKSRFKQLQKFLKNAKAAILIPLMFMALNSDVKAEEQQQAAQPQEKSQGDSIVERLKVYHQESLSHAMEFGELLVQDQMGRVKPVNSLSNDVLNKMARKTSMYGMNSEQIILGMITSPNIWKNVKMIKVSHPELKKILGIDKKDNHIAFGEVFNEKGYKLGAYLNDAHNKRPSERGTFEKDLIKVDERLNVAYMIYTGGLLQMFPKPNDPNNKWFSPMESMTDTWLAEEMKENVRTYFEAVIENNWKVANAKLQTIKDYQEKYGKEVFPSDMQVKSEIIFNELGIFQKLTPYYIILGLLLLVYSIFSVFTQKETKLIHNIFLGALWLGFLAHTFGMGLRWYISGHAPWSDSYESLLYIGWATVLAGVLFFRKSVLALTATAILAGITMFVAHLSWIDPQITNLVPVLKSYWLTIHVSIITASYGFLGLGAMLGFLAMLLMIMRSPKRTHLDQQIRQITAINEIALIIGLAMLTIGNFLGGVWANESWGRYWGWDPKETWTLVSIVTYVIVTHLRFIPKLNSVYAFCVASTLALSTIIMTYFGVNFYLSGMHSYASGDPVPIPNFVYYTIAVVFTVIALAYRKRDVERIK